MSSSPDYVFPDGSTRRMVRGHRKLQCQLVCMMLRWAEEKDDEDHGREAIAKLRNQAEEVFVHEWLTTNQRDFVRSFTGLEADRDESGGDYREVPF